MPARGERIPAGGREPGMERNQPDRVTVLPRAPGPDSVYSPSPPGYGDTALQSALLQHRYARLPR
jgi:hypothetical protein